MSTHYTKAELELYRHHQMSLVKRIACAAHLKECPQCSQLLDELKRDDEFVQDLRYSLELYARMAKEAFPESAKQSSTTLLQ